MKVTVEVAVVLLAREAKRLTVGMQDRVQRLPDIADYIEAFKRAIKQAEDTK